MKWLNKSVFEHYYKSKYHSISIDSHAEVKVDDYKVQIDPLLLFQRLIISGSQANDLTNVLTYEVCNYSTALFEANDRLLKAVKSQLAAFI